MAKIRIHNMMFYGFHGVYEYEREQGQKFYIDVEVETKDDKVADSDALSDGVDAAAIYDIVKDVTENKRKYSHFAAVKTTIRKPSVPISGPIEYVEAEITRYAK